MFTVSVKLLALVSRSLFLSNSSKSHSAASQDVLVECFNCGVHCAKCRSRKFFTAYEWCKKENKGGGK